ncbi:MAG: hypothetical protein NTX16_07130 [Actinobacteria bacterium]|nr:hypothetical protein [Actinomycetota bacterium]
MTAVLHAKQYLVFFAIGLYTLDFAVPIGSAWLYRHEPLTELLRHTWGPLADAVAARSAVIAAVFVTYLLVGAWLRAGYIRSLVGPFHLRPADRRQFLRLLTLQLALEIVGALAAGAILLAGDDLLPANLVVLGLLAFYLVVLYADYIIVIGDVGPLRAIALSLRTVRATLLPSALILLAVTLLGAAASGLLDEEVTGSLTRAAPMMLVQCVIMGGVVFVADVVLVVLYLNAAETGRLKPAPRSAGDGRML